LKASARACTCHHPPSNKQVFQWVRKSVVPDGGWTYENFVGTAKTDMQQDILALRRAALSRGLRTTAGDLRAVMRGHVTRTVDTALASFSRLYGIPLKAWQGRKSDFDFAVPNEASMWADAIEQELKLAGTQVSAVMTPAVQSVASGSFDKVNVLLGSTPTNAQLTALGVPVRSIAANVGNITNYTKTLLRRDLAHALRKKMTVFETAEYIRKRIPTLADNRVPTIVRTELGKANDEAIKHGMEVSEVVTHFDVIGCEAIEPGIPTYNGIPTCNIKNVPMTARAYIRFHPNHTGCIVPGAFKQHNGSIPTLPLRQGVGAGIPVGG
tara:strand:+ start:535 stop:1509 length:975 start_codon:yes stop_codon:yes gene_type:complete